MGLSGWRNFIFVFAIVTLATACSVANYNEPIANFASATKQAEEALVALDKQVTDAYADLQKAHAISGKKFVKAVSKDCLSNSDRCRLILIARGKGEILLSPDPALQKTIAVMGAIRGYAESLTAILNADTAEKVKTNVNITLGKVQNITETIAKQRGATASLANVSEFTTQAGKVVNWLVGQYVAKVKLDGLKRATKAAKQVIVDAADLFGASAEIASSVPKAALADAVAKRTDAFRTSRTASNLDKLIKSAATFDRFLLAKPSQIFIRLKEAHNSLADKLADDKLSLANVMAKIEIFAAEAKTLAKILKDLAAIGEQKKEG